MQSGYQIKSIVRIEALRAVWFGSLLMALIAIVAALLWYSTPRFSYVILGTLAEYSSSDTPILVERDGQFFYVLNTGDELIVFVPKATDLIGCRTIWTPSNARFEDPCLASKWTIMGHWIDGPATRDLDRYSYRIVNGQIEVETWRVIRADGRHPEVQQNVICRSDPNCKKNGDDCNYTCTEP